MVSHATLGLQIQRGADALQLPLGDHSFTIWGGRNLLSHRNKIHGASETVTDSM